MSKFERKQIVKIFLIGFLLGASLVFIWISSASIESFLNSVESISLAFAALFTAWWTYNSFGKSELRKEAKRFIELLDDYANAVDDIIRNTPVLDSLIKYSSDEESQNQWKEQLDYMAERKKKIAVDLQRLYDSATHIPDGIRVELLLYGDFFFDDVTKESHSEFRSRVVSLKNKLRRSVRI